MRYEECIYWNIEWYEIEGVDGGMRGFGYRECVYYKQFSREMAKDQADVIWG